MKITHLLLTHSFAGSERYAVELANAQAADHDVTMILHERAAEDRPNAIAHRLDTRVKQIRVGGWKLFAVLKARRILLELAPDVAHAHLSQACRALHGLGGRCLRVATLHIKYKPQQHRNMDALIAIAPWQLDDVPPAQRRHTVQIDNWTKATPYDPDARLRLRAELGFADDDFVLGALGRVEASKGLDLLLDAYLSAPRDKMRLVIVGGGRDWLTLRRRAPPEVVMPGFVSRPQDWFSAFDGFVSAARSEPFGLVFLEAMAAGLPIIATASQGGRLFASHIGRPVLPIDDLCAMSEALATLGTDRPPRRDYDLGAYSIDRASAQIEEFYRRELQCRS